MSSRRSIMRYNIPYVVHERTAEAHYRRQLEEERQRAIEESHWVLEGKEEEDRYESLVGTVAKKFSTKRKCSSVGTSFEGESCSIHHPSKKQKESS